MKKFHHLTLAALSLAALLPQACGLIEVEEVTEIDTTSTLAKGTEVTVVAEKKITLGDFLNFGEGSGANGIIQVSAEGDYSIEYNLEPQSIGDGFTFDASAFELNVNNAFNQSMSLTEATIPAHTPISYNEADRAAVELYFQNFASGVDIAFFESLLSQKYEFNFNIDFTIPGFPELIKSFKKADLDGNFTFTLVPSGIPFQKFVFKKDTKISLPSFLKFSSCSNADFTLVNGSELVANKDVNVPMGSGLAFTLALQSLDKGNGVPTAGSLALVGNVSVDGTISISPADFTGQTEVIDLESYPVLVAAGVLTGDGPHTITLVKENTSLGSFNVSCTYTAANVALKNATIQLSKDAIPAFDGNYGFDIGNLPKELSADGNTIELSDVQVNLSVNSTLPFDFGLNANLDAIGNRKYQLGPLSFDADSETRYVLGDFEDKVLDGVKYKKVEGLGQILNPVPSRIEVKDFEISFDENQWITVESGKNYGGSFQAGVKAPIAFTQATSLSLGYEMNDLDVDLSVAGDFLKGDTKAVIKLQAINEIPFKFGLSISALDADKKPIEGVKITPDVIEIGAGTIAKPETSTPEITIVLPSGSKLIKGISIKFNATVDSDHAGEPLNKNQSLTLKNVRLSLPDGITMDIKDVVKK